MENDIEMIFIIWNYIEKIRLGTGFVWKMYTWKILT